MSPASLSPSAFAAARGEERGPSVGPLPFREFLRASTEGFPTWFDDIPIYPATAVQRLNGLFIFLKLYLFWFFSSVEHGGSTKGFKETKEERSEYILVSILYIYSGMLSFRTDILRPLVN